MATPLFKARGGSLGTLATIPLGGKASSAQSEAFDKQCGTEVEDGMGNVFRLVRLNAASGLATSAVQYMSFGYSALADDATRTFDVEPNKSTSTKPLDKVAGFGLPNQVALDDNDYFWLHVDGPVIQGYLGDDGTDLAIGDFVNLDDDADLGKLKSGADTFDAEYTVGVSLTTEAGTDAVVRFVPRQKFRGCPG
jgi:hypothetical protein